MLITLSSRSQHPLCSVVEFCAAKCLFTTSHAEIWFGSHLQNPSTDVSAAGLTFHPVLGVVICLTVRHSIPATQTMKTLCVREIWDDTWSWYICVFSEGKHENHTFKSLVFIPSVSLYAHSLADVLSREDHVAGPTPKAADVPLFLQCQERLTLLDLVSTTRAVWRRQGRNKKKMW